MYSLHLPFLSPIYLLLSPLLQPSTPFSSYAITRAPLTHLSLLTALLTMVGMGGRLDHVPSQLSGGEQQRVCLHWLFFYILVFLFLFLFFGVLLTLFLKVTIARAMANKPDILLLDEPTYESFYPPIFYLLSHLTPHVPLLFSLPFSSFNLLSRGDLDTANTAIVMKLLTQLNKEEGTSLPFPLPPSLTS